ncbi:indole-3-glycerol phosphate synthase [Marchantia polymorpha subsp. ruderalis]|uniref:indole-3-glycerol-phosphate synthase n=2 Tax=Marchantia polymorpha TaxID=3197 RepID=A0AAF6AW30_MARPO|nr:hypothetical protein MARPO_0007s0091 [Marchantia polymorpha]BBN03964.1 hypothetical protein Mp_3g00950 [Marchantia polymorpha subsp. ruderalis]|eukprot:PTQ47653.1 hypothetical protein MARPO_0007s0091 [Marchantia polymorpha]
MASASAFLPCSRLQAVASAGLNASVSVSSSRASSSGASCSFPGAAKRVVAGGCSTRLRVARCCSFSVEEENEDVVGPPVLNFQPKSNMPEAPPEWKEKEAERVALMIEKEGISIRRRPETGPPLHNVGAFQFKLQNAGNTPRNILEEIVWSKDIEVTGMKERMPIGTLKRLLATAEPARDFVGALRERAAETGVPGLIAEVKKASPSRGVIQPNFDPVRIAKAYEAGGAACLSVLTDQKYFQGCFENLKLIRAAGVQCPLLCKEFIIDAWQLFNARVHGADAVLLIAAVLPDQDLKYMSRIAKSLGLAVLIEVHSEREMDRVLALPTVDLIGINNRNLETFEVDIQNTVRLLEGERGQIIRDRGILMVGESGLFTPADIAVVQNAGCGAVLVGESLVKQDDPRTGIAGLFGKDISRSPNPTLEVSAA